MKETLSLERRVREAIGEGSSANPPTYDDVQEFWTTPDQQMVETLRRIDGDILVAGVGGKMGGELVKALSQANEDPYREIIAVSRFTDPKIKDDLFVFPNVTVLQSDMLEPGALDGLPDAPNVIFMAGRKFGVNDEETEITAHATNILLPAMVANRFPDSKLVIFSSGNPYPAVTASTGGSKENDRFVVSQPYSSQIVGRENSVRYWASKGGTPVAYYRLWYAQHTCYGAIVDIAKLIRGGNTIYLDKAPQVNVVSQREANLAAVNALLLASNLGHGKKPIVQPQWYEGERNQNGTIINVAGPIVPVRHIANLLGEVMEMTPILEGKEDGPTLLGNDQRYRRLFGEYRDGVDHLIRGIGIWVKNGGEDWNKPTYFGLKAGF